MITDSTIVAIDKNIRNRLKKLDPHKRYALSSDEGGMMGNPRFNVNNRKKQKPYFRYIASMYKNDIIEYILGRLTTWEIANKKDYSTSMQISVDI